MCMQATPATAMAALTGQTAQAGRIAPWHPLGPAPLSSLPDLAPRALTGRSRRSHEKVISNYAPVIIEEIL